MFVNCHSKEHKLTHTYTYTQHTISERTFIVMLLSFAIPTKMTNETKRNKKKTKQHFWYYFPQLLLSLFNICMYSPTVYINYVSHTHTHTLLEPESNIYWFSYKCVYNMFVNCVCVGTNCIFKSCSIIRSFFFRHKYS